VTIYALNPLKDSRWKEFVEAHPSASVFHTLSWLEALRLTYGYEPVVFTTSPPQSRLTNGIAFCRISSWLTGRRMVSLPFADHCEPLLESDETSKELIDFLRSSIKENRWKYIEIRPLSSTLLAQVSSQEKGSAFCFHVIDLNAPVEDLFRSLQKSSMQRSIRRAEREGLVCEQGRSEALLSNFYGLMLKTRRRHKLPPQPISWFRNLSSCLGERLNIRVAMKNGEPIASILTLSHRSTLVYKYGCSDERYHNLGPVPFLFWDAIREAKGNGLHEFDLGRSDLTNPGLITFKTRLGARASTLEYVRFSAAHSAPAAEDRGMHMAKRLFACMPDGLLTTAGKLLYRHIG
jgi:lipid II:glycine glycyltransferase (peptidoglycan interpeptide bridge formation enzyme)